MEIIREWVIAQHIKLEYPAFRSAERADDVPTDYGTYAVHDGIRLMGFGYGRNLREKFLSCREARDYFMFIFLWQADDDGSVRKYLNRDWNDRSEAEKAATGGGEEGGR